MTMNSRHSRAWRRFYRFTLTLAALWVLPGLNAPAARAGGISFQDLTLAEVQARADREDKLFFLYFSANWCMPCRWMESETFLNEKLATYTREHYLAVKIDMDQPRHQALREQFGIDKLPTLLVFSAGGTLVQRLETALTAEELLRELRAVDVPANHLLPLSQAPAQNGALLEAPQPRLGITRPGLAPEPTTAAPERLVVGTDRPTGAAVSREPTLTARSGTRWSVQTAVFTDYQQAVQEAGRLDERYGHRAEILTEQLAGQLRYRIVVGKFEKRSQALDFLIYLNRNDLLGEVIALPVQSAS